jgi:hypothetical protein
MANDMSPTIGRLFEMSTFLDGPVTAWGIFEDRFGTLRRSFRVEMSGHWEGGKFLITEDFAYDDGETERRVWAIEPQGQGRFIGRTADCVGEASGQSYADRTLMKYRFKLRIKGREWLFDFDDRLYRIDDHRAFNRATVSKWGFTIGHVSIFFQRHDAPALRAA